MTYFMLLAMAIQIVLLIVSKKEIVSKKYEESKITKPFYRAGAFIFRKTLNKDNGDNFYYRNIFEKNSLIYAAKECKEITNDYFVEKLGLCCLVIFVGTFFLLVMSFKNNSEGILKDNYKIERGDYNSKDQRIYLNANVGSEKFEDVEIAIPAIKYTQQEFFGLIDEFEEKLMFEFLMENESLDFVNRDVNFVQSLTDYPFLVEWKWDKKNCINSNGEILDGINESGEIVNVIATISYEEYISEYEFCINVYPKEVTKKEMIRHKISELLMINQDKTKEDKYYILPEEIDGITISWQEKKSKNLLVFLGLVFVTALAVFFGKDMDIDKQIENRNKQMMEDYSEIIGKLTLLVGAGMSVVGAWKKIATDYKNKKKEGEIRYAFEEMLYTMYEMESGVTENICYQHFANRVKVQKYVKFVSLLEQNIKMGSKGLIEDLKAEAKEAFAERKNLAEKKGEESATKLLLPMFMMLLIVMVVIMVPAFMSM